MRKNQKKLVKQATLKTSTSSTIKKNRIFSETFKRAKVAEIENKLITVTEISRIHQVSKTSIYKWIRKYSTTYEKQTKIVIEMNCESKKTQYYQQRVSELERIVGQKQLEIDYLHKLLEISSKELDIDLKKNFGTMLSNTSENDALDSIIS